MPLMRMRRQKRRKGIRTRGLNVTKASAVHKAEVAEWQTRRTQNPVYASRCGFKSHLRHYGAEATKAVHQSRMRRRHGERCGQGEEKGPQGAGRGAGR